MSLEGHIQAASAVREVIPAPLTSIPHLPKPAPVPALETYSVVVSQLPLNKLLAALARDAKINIDVHPDVAGSVTLNAINQTLPQILERIARQADIRWTLEGGILTIAPDLPYLKTYHVDYFNLSRNMKASVTILNSVTTAAQGSVSGNSSSTGIDSENPNQFWKRLESNLKDLLGNSAAAASNPVIMHPESGTISIRATQKDQLKVAEFLAAVQSAAQRQVMIEATIVEVALGDQYQAGVDWSKIASGSGWSLSQSLLGANLTTAPVSVLSYANDSFGATIKLLEQFGRTRVLSSPKIIALNNQTAVMKVVEEQVYFTLELEEDKNTDGEVTGRTYLSQLHTVPVGLVMQVTPQVSAAGQIAMNVRPTITNISGYVEDPAVALIARDSAKPVQSLIPVLQVREFDSTLNIASGQAAVLGGLIQDKQNNSRQGLPGLSRLPVIGDVFSYRDDKVSKIELVVFLRPVVVQGHGLSGGQAAFKLPDTHFFNPASDHQLSAFQGGLITGELAP
ncbi:type II secretion system protein GspD [Chitinibacter sp. S2-10]|uniref:type II secretion system protein GspD n=1 Tax=Chitinibacter sp. S2-10 TaxID=3373597 RepID=UPI003977B21C